MKNIQQPKGKVLTLCIVLLVFVFANTSCKPNPQTVNSDTNDTIISVPQRLAWGIPIDSVDIDTLKIQSGQNLSHILSAQGISAQKIDQIAKNSNDIFDVRKLKAGKSFFLIHQKKHHTPQFLIYEDTQTDYYVFNIDSCLVSKGAKPVETAIETTGGIIESSLWNALVQNNASPLLSLHLSEIFAWTIDFFGIQPGDRYKIVYEALYIDGEYAGIGKIHAAEFENMGENTSAFFFSNQTQEGFFDEKGNSLRKAFLKAPLNFKRISSRFSHSRLHPVLKIRRPHRGVDYAAPTGTPVYSIGDGAVVKKGYQKNGGGNYINIKHNSVYTSQYMHLSKFAPGMAPGVKVKQGQLIGYVGMTGLATGPHLDFRMYKNGNAVDPLKIESPPVEPILPENKKHFTQLRDSLNQILQQITIEKNDELLVSQ